MMRGFTASPEHLIVFKVRVVLLFVVCIAVCEANYAGGLEWTLTAINSVAVTHCPRSFSGIGPTPTSLM